MRYTHSQYSKPLAAFEPSIGCGSLVCNSAHYRIPCLGVACNLLFIVARFASPGLLAVTRRVQRCQVKSPKHSQFALPLFCQLPRYVMYLVDSTSLPANTFTLALSYEQGGADNNCWQYVSPVPPKVAEIRKGSRSLSLFA